MKQWFANQQDGGAYDPPSFPEGAEFSPTPGAAGGGLLGDLRDVWQWDQVAAEVRQEGQARIGILGSPGSGKRCLFNRLRDWQAAWPETSQPESDTVRVEAYGAFVPADLPATDRQSGGRLLPSVEKIMLTLGDPNLLLYLVDATAGVQEADYRWVARLRATGRPLVVALNKCDVVDALETAVHTASRRLGMRVIPISAMTGQNVKTTLLPALLDAAPRAAISLGREIGGLRRLTAWRIIRQSALMAGLMSAQPIPFLDLPFQAMLHVGVVMRVGAIYGRAPGGGIGRETVGAAVGYLGLNYLAQSAAKLVPVLGWAVSGGLGTGATLLIGEAAIRYYEAGATVPLRQFWQHGRQRWRRMIHLWRAWAMDKMPGRKEEATAAQIIPVVDEGAGDDDECGGGNGRLSLPGRARLRWTPCAAPG